MAIEFSHKIFGDRAALRQWLRDQPLQWSLVLATRAALRIFPDQIKDGQNAAPAFRLAAVVRLAAKHPNRPMQGASLGKLPQDMGSLHILSFAAKIANYVADARGGRAPDSNVYHYVTNVLDWRPRGRYGSNSQYLEAFTFDANALVQGTDFRKVVDSRLWSLNQPPIQDWTLFIDQLSQEGSHWKVWIDWYNKLLTGDGDQIEDAIFVENLPWNQGYIVTGMRPPPRGRAIHLRYSLA
jgi:hypothetical protein